MVEAIEVLKKNKEEIRKVAKDVLLSLYADESLSTEEALQFYIKPFFEKLGFKYVGYLDNYDDKLFKRVYLLKHKKTGYWLDISVYKNLLLVYIDVEDEWLAALFVL